MVNVLVDGDASGGLTNVYVAILAVHDAELLQTGKSWGRNRVNAWQGDSA